MAGHIILLNLIGGVALLLWGTHMVQAAILQGLRRRDPRRHRPRRRRAAARGRPPGPRPRRALQSATATAMLLAAFVTRGLIALPAALALMLGADLGTTLAVQALSVDLGGADAAPARSPASSLGAHGASGRAPPRSAGC